MRAHRDSRRLRTLCALVAAASLAGALGAGVATAEVVAVVNDDNPVSSITLHELRLMYGLYRRSWEGGIRVVLVLPEADSEAGRLLSDVVFRGRYGDLEPYYRTAVFQQRIAVLPDVASGPAALPRVRAERGAIALVERERITDTDGVRLLAIGGRN